MSHGKPRTFFAVHRRFLGARGFLIGAVISALYSFLGAELMGKRVIRIVLLGVGLACGMEVSRTTPYLGLPFEPKPTFLDCYPQAKWDGLHFIPTGREICLGAH